MGIVRPTRQDDGFQEAVARYYGERARRAKLIVHVADIAIRVVLAFLVAWALACVPAQTARQTAPDAAWCRNVQTRGWTLSAATQGLGALSASLAVVAATQDGDRALTLNITGAIVAAIGVATAHLGSQHASAYAEQCGRRQHQKEDTR